MKKVIFALSVILLFSTVATAFRVKQSKHISSITLRRTGCYGTCPDYSIEIKKDGSAIFTGYRFTKDSGVFQKKLKKEEVQKIMQMVQTYRLDTCKDRYPYMIADIPIFYFVIQYSKKNKKIDNATFGPFFLKDIANEMDRIANKTNNEGWEKMSSDAKK